MRSMYPSAVWPMKNRQSLSPGAYGKAVLFGGACGLFQTLGRFVYLGCLLALSHALVGQETFLKDIGADPDTDQVLFVDSAIDESTGDIYFIYRIRGDTIVLDDTAYRFNAPEANHISVLAKMSPAGAWLWARAFEGDYQDLTLACVAARDEIVAVGGRFHYNSQLAVRMSGYENDFVHFDWRANQKDSGFYVILSGVETDNPGQPLHAGSIQCQNADMRSGVTAIALASDIQNKGLDKLLRGKVDHQVRVGAYYTPSSNNSNASADFMKGVIKSNANPPGAGFEKNFSLKRSQGAHRRVAVVAGAIDDKWEWAHQFVTEEAGGYNTFATANQDSNRVHHSHIRKLVVDDRDRTYFAGRLSGGILQSGSASGSALIVEYKHRDGSTSEVDVGWSIWNTFVFGRIGKHGGFHAINLDADSGAPQAESIATDITLANDWGYVTGVLRGSSVHALELNGEGEEVVEEIWDRLATDVLDKEDDDEGAYRPFILRFDTNPKDSVPMINYAVIGQPGNHLTTRIASFGVLRTASEEVYVSLALPSGLTDAAVYSNDYASPSSQFDLESGYALIRLKDDLSLEGGSVKPGKNLIYPADPARFGSPELSRFNRKTGDGVFGHFEDIDLVDHQDGKLSNLVFNRINGNLFWNGGVLEGVQYAGDVSVNKASLSKTEETESGRAFITGFNLDQPQTTAGGPAFLQQVVLRLESNQLPENPSGIQFDQMVSPVLNVNHYLIQGNRINIKAPHKIESDLNRDSDGVVSDATVETIYRVRYNSDSTFRSAKQYFADDYSWPFYPRIRRTFINHQIIESGETNPENQFTLILDSNKTVVLNYREQLALDVIAVVQGDVQTTRILQDEELRILGNPSYSTDSGLNSNLNVEAARPALAESKPWGQTFIDRGETVEINIGTDGPGVELPFGERFIVDSFAGSGDVADSESDFIPTHSFSLEQFTMDSPGSLKINWKKQIQIQLGPLEKKRAQDLVYVKTLESDDSIPDWEKPYTDASETDLVAHWFDFGIPVVIAAAPGKGLKPNGWLSAGGHFPTSQGQRKDLSFLSGNERTLDSGASFSNAFGLRIARLTKPTFVTFNYGGIVFTEYRSIGVPLSIKEINAQAETSPIQDDDDPTPNSYDTTSMNGWIDTTIEPVVSVVSDAPPGTTPANGVAWSVASEQLHSLRPGRYLIQFRVRDTIDSTANTNVYIELNAGFPGDAVSSVFEDHDTNHSIQVFPKIASTLWTDRYQQAHYLHIAHAPPVELDSDPTDGHAFLDMPYTEASARLQNGGFVNTTEGRSVLLFSRSIADEPSTFPAVGDRLREELFVRVVETRDARDASAMENGHWDNSSSSLIFTGVEKTIGTPITSSSDTAGLGTGWTLYDSKKLLINPWIYNRDGVQGPIIPVNLRLPGHGLDIKDELVVVWYENLGFDADGDEPDVNWPYQPVWYKSENFVVPHEMDVRYTGFQTAKPPLPDATGNVIWVASRLGSNGLRTEASETYSQQLDLFAQGYEEIQIYHQPDPNAQGYNPNEEHALIAPAIFQQQATESGTPHPVESRSGDDDAFAVFALREDLNLSKRQWHNSTEDGEAGFSFPDDGAEMGVEYTSEPMVLVQYFDPEFGEHRMRVYFIGYENDLYKFQYEATAGNLVKPPYPVDTVVGLTPFNDSDQTNNNAAIDGTYYLNGRAENGFVQAVWWTDPAGNVYAISGSVNNSDPHFFAGYYYALQNEFWHSEKTLIPGDPIPWLPDAKTSNGQPNTDGTPVQGAPAMVRFDTVWPDVTKMPLLKLGETLTYAGGEFKKDHPFQIDAKGNLSETPGLPGVIGWAAGQILFDSENPDQSQDLTSNFAARLMNPLERRGVALSETTVRNEDSTFTPGNDAIRISGGAWRFTNLSASLQRRIAYDPSVQRLEMRGYVSERTLGDPNLTASPDPVYVLEPNILTASERDELASLFTGNTWSDAVKDLYQLSRNPDELQLTDSETSPYLTGLEVREKTVNADLNGRSHKASFGPGLAVVPNAALLKSTSGFEKGYLTLVENAHPDDPALSPVTLHILRLDADHRYRGAIKTVMSPNVFDEKILVKHTADFGAALKNVEYEWYYTPTAPGDVGAPSHPGPVGNWQRLNGVTSNEFIVQGDPTLLLGDMLWFARYKHIADPAYNTELNDPFPWEWAGAGNSPQLQANGSVQYLPQLVMGWMKRVLDRVNPYEARFSDFENNESPATYSSLIQQAGPPFLGPVGLNPDKNVVENVGLIELYQTILNRGIGVSLDLDQPAQSFSIWQALMLAGTRLNQLYMLLGNEAYSDAMDPTIGFGSAIDPLAPTLFAFQNMEQSLLHEELALLRGTDYGKGYPVNNRLFWNFVKGQGEVAYASNYNIKDVTADGFINEFDAKALFPQGHGDAWGHYLSAAKSQYALLRHPHFTWQTFAELYNLMDIVLEVDYLDEIHFARTAAAKARAGGDIVRNTYRKRYVEDPEGQFHGYEDVDPSRAWGVNQWAARAGQASYFDWAVANSLMPYQEIPEREEYTGNGIATVFDFDFTVSESFHLRVFLDGVLLRSKSDYTTVLLDQGGTVTFDAAPEDGSRITIDNVLGIDSSANQLDRIDRVSVPELAELALYAGEIQDTLDQANAGMNPLGLSGDTVTFDIDPQQLDRRYVLDENDTSSATHFEQIYARALKAGRNALAAFDFANRAENRLREIADATDQIRVQAAGQDRSFRGRLIDIFGTPYEGLIGPTGVFPPGYDGPDLLLYQYVDSNDPNAFIPLVSPLFKDLFDLDTTSLVARQQDLLIHFGNRNVVNFLLEEKDPFALKSLIKSFTDLDVEDNNGEYNTFYDRFEAGEDFTIRKDGTPIPFPMETRLDAAYGLVPEDETWGKRRATGEIQIKIQELVGVQIDLLKNLDDYEGYLRVLKATIREQQAGVKGFAVNLQQETALTSLEQILGGAKLLKKSVQGILSLNRKTSEDLWKVAYEALPKSVGTLQIDAFAPMRGALLSSLALANVPVNVYELAAETIFDWAEYSFNLEKDIFDLDAMARGFKAEQRQFVHELLDDLSNESTLRFAIAENLNVLVQRERELDAVIAKGFRLVAERAAANKRLAGETQQNRYADALLRVNRNDALQRYHGALDVALRYAHLAAKAYDYETNFDPGHPASIRPLLTQLTKIRTLGLWSEGKPQLGQGGLAEMLARMKANFDALNGQLGFNNPQSETGRFSLRHEWARIKPGVESDARWRKTLQSFRVEDLRAVTSFRRYSRPFAPSEDGPQPGLVLTFRTEIESGRNFFGHALGGLDHAYDASHFATKIRSVGAWFTDYDKTGLSLTPRVYLVPVGTDIMLAPDSAELARRAWNIIDQRIPVPYPVSDSNLRDPDWLVSSDSLLGSFAEARKFSAFRAYHDSGDWVDESEMTWDSRLVGRSVWNTGWALIIPGAFLHADPELGLDRFVGSEHQPGVSDIRLLFKTYSHSGN